MALLLCFKVSPVFSQTFAMEDIQGEYHLTFPISGECPSSINIFDKNRHEISVQKCSDSGLCYGVTTMNLGFKSAGERLKTSTHIYPTRIGNDKRALVFNHFLLQTPVLRASRVLSGSEYILAESENGDGQKLIYNELGQDKTVKSSCMYSAKF